MHVSNQNVESIPETLLQSNAVVKLKTGTRSQELKYLASQSLIMIRRLSARSTVLSMNSFITLNPPGLADRLQRDKERLETVVLICLSQTQTYHVAIVSKPRHQFNAVVHANVAYMR